MLFQEKQRPDNEHPGWPQQAFLSCYIRCIKKAHLYTAHCDLPNFCVGCFFMEALNYRYPTPRPQAKPATGRWCGSHLYSEVPWLLTNATAQDSFPPGPTAPPMPLVYPLSTSTMEWQGTENCCQYLFSMQTHLMLNEWLVIVHTFPGHNLNSQKLWNPHLHFHEVLWGASGKNDIMGGRTTTSKTDKKM